MNETERKPPLISVIVPVYNNEAEISHCLHSVLKQTHKNLEIILVDDGSTDQSGGICDAWKHRDARIAVVHQENRGAAAARNAGLNVAQGSWVAFLDCDDHILPDMYEYLLDLAEKYCAHMSQCGFWEERNGKCGRMRFCAREEKAFHGRLSELSAGDFAAVSYALWNKLYQRAWIGEQRLSEDLPVGEDLEFNMRLMCTGGRIAVGREAKYFYQIRDGSLAHTLCGPDGLLMTHAALERIQLCLQKQGETSSLIFEEKLRDCLDICSKLVRVSSRDRPAEAIRKEIADHYGYILLCRRFSVFEKAKFTLIRSAWPVYRCLLLRSKEMKAGFRAFADQANRLKAAGIHRLKRNSYIRATVFQVKKWYGCLRGSCACYRPPAWTAAEKTVPFEKLKFAVICDELTWENLRLECNAVYLTPQNWRKEMERVRPDVFFCEAAWEGTDGSWGNKVFRDLTLHPDNRFVLLDIIRYCREAGIPTVFWNKEDTPAFSDGPYSFIATAMLFDHIFTTAEECVPQYQALGHRSVHCMMFGFSPQLFYPLPPAEGGTAVFFGSWYENNKERCADMAAIFDAVLEWGLTLKIYDRASGRGEADRRFPAKYRPYIYPAVSYPDTREVMRDAKYVININSVRDSRTMFARRVFETMACGRVIISNESVGLRQLFPDSILFPGDPICPDKLEEMVEKNLSLVKKYTFSAQLRKALESAAIIERTKKGETEI